MGRQEGGGKGIACLQGKREGNGLMGMQIIEEEVVAQPSNCLYLHFHYQIQLKLPL